MIHTIRNFPLGNGSLLPCTTAWLMRIQPFRRHASPASTKGPLRHAVQPGSRCWCVTQQGSGHPMLEGAPNQQVDLRCFDLDGSSSRAGTEDPGNCCHVSSDGLRQGLSINSSSKSTLSSRHVLHHALHLLMDSCCPPCVYDPPSQQQQQQLQLLQCLEAVEAAATRFLEEEGLPVTTNRKGSREAGRRYARRKEKQLQRRARDSATQPAAELQLHSLGSKQRTGGPMVSRSDWAALLSSLQAAGVRIGPALELLLYQEVQPWSNDWSAGVQNIHPGAADSGGGKEDSTNRGEEAAACVPEELARLVCCVCLLPAPSRSPRSTQDSNGINSSSSSNGINSSSSSNGSNSSSSNGINSSRSSSSSSTAPVTSTHAISAPLPAVPTTNEEEERAALEERAGSHAHASTSSLSVPLKSISSSSISSSSSSSRGGTPGYTAPLGLDSAQVASVTTAAAGAVPGVLGTKGMLGAAARTIRHQWLSSALSWLTSLPTGSTKSSTPQQQQQQQEQQQQEKQQQLQRVSKQAGVVRGEHYTVPLGALADVACALVRSDHQVTPSSTWLPQLYASTLPVLQQQQQQQQEWSHSVEQVECLAWAVSKLVQAGAPPPPIPWLQALEAVLLNLCTHTTLELHHQQRLSNATAEQVPLHQQHDCSDAGPALGHTSTSAQSQVSPQPPSPPLSPSSSTCSNSRQAQPTPAPARSPDPLPQQAASFVLYPPNTEQPLSPSTSTVDSSASHPSLTAVNPTTSAASASSAACSCVALLVSLTHIHLAGESPSKAAAAQHTHQAASRRRRSGSVSGDGLEGDEGVEGGESETCAGTKGLPPSPLTLCALTHCAAAASKTGLLPLSSYAELLWALARLQWHPGEEWLAFVGEQLLAHAARTREEPGTGTERAMGNKAEAEDGAGNARSTDRQVQQVPAGVHGLQQQHKQQQQQQQQVLAGLHGLKQTQQEKQEQLPHQGNTRGVQLRGLSGTKAAQALWALAVLLEQPPSQRHTRQHRHQERMFEQQLQAQHRRRNQQQLQQQPGLHEHDSTDAWAYARTPVVQPLLPSPAAAPSPTHVRAASAWLQLLLPALEAEPPALTGPTSMVTLLWSLATLTPLLAAQQQQELSATETQAEVEAQSARLAADTQACVVDLLHELLPACARTLHATSPHMAVMALWSAARLLPELQALQNAPQQPAHKHQTKGSTTSSNIAGSSTESREGNNLSNPGSTCESSPVETILGPPSSGSSTTTTNTTSTTTSATSTFSKSNGDASSRGGIVDLLFMLADESAGLVGRSAPMLTPQDLVTAGRALVDAGWQGASWEWMAVFAYACRSRIQRMQPGDHADLLEALAQLVQLHQGHAAHMQQQQQQKGHHSAHMQKKLGAAAKRVGTRGTGDGIQELAELGLCSAGSIAQSILPLHNNHHFQQQEQQQQEQQQEQGQEGLNHAAGVRAQEAVHLLEALNAVLHTLLQHYPPSPPPHRTWSVATTTQGAAATAPGEAVGSKAVLRALCDALREVLTAAEGQAVQMLEQREQSCLHQLPNSREQAWVVWDKVQLLGAAAELRTCTKAWLKHCGMSPTAHSHSPTMTPASSSPFAHPPSSPGNHAAPITWPLSSTTTATSSSSSSNRTISSSSNMFTSPSLILTPTSNPQAPLLIRPRPSPLSQPSSPSPCPPSSSLSPPSPQSNSSQTPSQSSSPNPSLINKPQPVGPSASTALLAQRLHAAVALPTPDSPLLPPPPPALSSLLSTCAPTMLRALQQLTEFNPLGDNNNSSNGSNNSSDNNFDSRENTRGLAPPNTLPHSLFTRSGQDEDEGQAQEEGTQDVDDKQAQEESTQPQLFTLRSSGRASRASRAQHAQHAAPLVLLMHAHAVWRAPVAPQLLLEAHRMLSPCVPSPSVASQLLQALAVLHNLRLLPGHTPPPTLKHPSRTSTPAATQPGHTPPPAATQPGQTPPPITTQPGHAPPPAMLHAPETVAPSPLEPFQPAVQPAVAAQQGNTAVSLGLRRSTSGSSVPSAQPVLSTPGGAAHAGRQLGWRPEGSTGAASGSGSDALSFSSRNEASNSGSSSCSTSTSKTLSSIRHSDTNDSSSSSNSSSPLVGASLSDAVVPAIKAGVQAQLQITSLLVSSWLSRGPHSQPHQGSSIGAGAPPSMPAHILGCLDLLAAGLHHTPKALLPSHLPRLLHFLAKYQQQQHQQQQQQRQQLAQVSPSTSPLSPSLSHELPSSSMNGRSLSINNSVPKSRGSIRRFSSSSSRRGKGGGGLVSPTSALWMSHSAPAHPAATDAVLRQLQTQVWQACLHTPLLCAALPARDMVSLLHGLARLRWIPPQAWHQSSRPHAFRQALLYLSSPGSSPLSHPTSPVHTSPLPQLSPSQPLSQTLPVCLQRPGKAQVVAPELGLGDMCCLLWSMSSLQVPLPSAGWLAAFYQRVADAVNTGNGGHEGGVAVESWVCLVWAAARLSGAANLADFEEGSLQANSGSSSNSGVAGSGRVTLWGASGVDRRLSEAANPTDSEEGSLQANSGIGSSSGSRKSETAVSDRGTVLGACGVDRKGDGDRMQMGLHGSGAENSSGLSNESAPSPSPIAAACGWLPHVCSQIAARVGGLSGSSLGCVVWGGGVLLEEISHELLLLGESGRGVERGSVNEDKEEDGLQQNAGRGNAADAGSSVGSEGARSDGSYDAVDGGGHAHSEQQHKAAVATVLSLAQLQAAAYSEMQSRLARHQPGSPLASHLATQSQWPVSAAAAAAASETPPPAAAPVQAPAAAAVASEATPAAPGSPAAALASEATPAAPGSPLASKARPAAPGSPAAALASKARPAAATAEKRKSRRARRHSTDLLQRAGLPLSAVLGACAGALQGRAALRAAALAGLLPQKLSIAKHPASPEGQDVVGTAQLLVSGPALPQVMLDALVSGLAASATPRQGVSCLSMLARFHVRPPKELRLQLYALLLPPLMVASRRRPLGFHHQQQQQQQQQEQQQQQQLDTSSVQQQQQQQLDTSSVLQQQQLDTSSVLSVSLSLARLRMRPPPPMSSVLVRALVAALPFIATQPGTHAVPMHGAAFGHAVWALAKLGAQLDGPAAAVVLEEVSRRLRMRALSSPALVHVLWGLAKLSALQPWHPAEPLLRTLFVRILEVVPKLGVTDVSRVVWAAASLDTKPPVLLCHALTAKALPEMRSASPHTLTTLLYGLAALGYRPPPAIFTAFFRATAAAMRHTPAKAKNPTDSNNTCDSGNGRARQRGSSSSQNNAYEYNQSRTGQHGSSSQKRSSKMALKNGDRLDRVGSSHPSAVAGSSQTSVGSSLTSAVAGSSHITGRGLARTLWALATLQRNPPSTWLALATRRLIQELPSCNAHDLTLAALGCAVLGPSLGKRQVAAFGAAVERQRRRRLAVQYERDKVAMVWAWGRLRARIQVDQEEKQSRPHAKGLQRRLRHTASSAQKSAKT